MIKHYKFNIIQIPNNRIVGGHKTLFPFEGATCQNLTQKRKAAEWNKGTQKENRNLPRERS